MTRVLVTGASGFIGRHLLPLLVARGHEVYAVSVKPEDPLAGVTWYETDLLDEGSTSALVASIQPTHLIHAAWSLDPGTYQNSAANLAWVRASLRLLEDFAAHGGRRVVVTGTCFEYDWTDGVCVEETPLRPRSLYGAAKAGLSQMSIAWARQAGVSLAWARLFFLYGPSEHPARLVASVTRSLLRGEPARCSHGQQRRDFLHVRDVAGGLAAVLETSVDGAVNIASGESVRLADLIAALADIIGRPDLVRLGEIPVPADDPPLIVGDVNRLKRETDWRPAFDLAGGLRHTVEWWRERLRAERQP